jgi:dienelactone hydrolase
MRRIWRMTSLVGALVLCALGGANAQPPPDASGLNAAAASAPASGGAAAGAPASGAPASGAPASAATASAATAPSAPPSSEGLVDAARFIDPVTVWSASISPNGRYIAYLDRLSDDTERVVVNDLVANTSTAINRVTKAAGVYDWVAWKGNERLIIGARAHRRADYDMTTGSRFGGSNMRYDLARVLTMKLDGSGQVELFQGQMNLLSWSYGSDFLLNDLRGDPTHVLLQADDNEGVGVWRADVNTGAVEKLDDGLELTREYGTDANGAPVLRLDELPDFSGYKILRRAPGAHDWTFVEEVRKNARGDETPDFEVLGPGPGPGLVYVGARHDSDFSQVYIYNAATGDFGQPVTAGEGADAGTPIFSPVTRQVLATCEFAQKYTCRSHDPVMQRNWNALDGFFEHQATVRVTDMSDDGTKWLLRIDGPTEPGGYYLYDTTSHQVTPFADIYPHLDTSALSPAEIVNYQSRDGTPLWAYVTAHPGVSGPRPMVVLPHGGPEGRDTFGYDFFAQFLASRGYVVVQPNFRGGGGFGRAFADAGHGQWGLRMQDDVTDAVQHMIDAGVADPHRICIVGASYGGYAALAGVALTPNLYKCAVSIAGVSDLLVMLQRETDGGAASESYQYWLRSIGDPSANHAALVAASPRLQVAHITAPVLLIHGTFDHTVPYSQSQLMQNALNGAGHPTRLVSIIGETHYWNEWSNDNRLILLRETENFLAANLGPPASH